MANGLLEIIKQQADVLTATEKLNLAAYLVKQAELDQAQKEVAKLIAQPDLQRRREYAWLNAHREEYAGQYVALFDDQLIAHGLDGRNVLQQAREAGFPRALLVRIESLDEPSFGGW